MSLLTDNAHTASVGRTTLEPSRLPGGSATRRQDKDELKLGLLLLLLAGDVGAVAGTLHGQYSELSREVDKGFISR